MIRTCLSEANGAGPLCSANSDVHLFRYGKRPDANPGSAAQRLNRLAANPKSHELHW